MCADKHEELLEVWTQDGRPTGEVKTRKVVHEQGLWHKIVHVWCVDPATRRVLLQRRSADKCTNPDKWDISCAGHIEAGEASLQGALKELHEELGVTAQPEKLQFLFTAPASGVYMNGTYFDNELQDIYLYETDVAVSSLVLQPEEVTDAKWVGWDEFEAQLDSGDESLVAVEKGEYGPLFALLRERYPLMKLRKLEELLDDVEAFPKPKVKLEQYPTSPHIAAHMLYTIANAYDEIEDRCIADLGCGCGMLAIAAQLMGSGYTIGLDIDDDALEVAQENAREFELEDQMEFVRCNVAELLPSQFAHKVDTVIMNPPFGTKIKGIDMVFLEKALHVAEVSVYSLHKSSTRAHIARKAERQWGVKAEVVAQLRFDIPQMYRFHKRESVDVEVDLWRFDSIAATAAAAAAPPKRRTHLK